MNYDTNTGRNACATLKLPPRFFAARCAAGLPVTSTSFSDLSLIDITNNHRFLIKITIKIVIRVETNPYLNPHLNPNHNPYLNRPIKDHEIPWRAFDEHPPSIRNCFIRLLAYGVTCRSNPTPQGPPFTTLPLCCAFTACALQLRFANHSGSGSPSESASQCSNVEC